MEGTMRRKSEQLKVLESLNTRTKLPRAESHYLLNLKKGFEGEQLFDQCLEKLLGRDIICLKDRLITFNGSTAQLDALILNGNNFYLYEVKNYEGEYEQHDGQFKRLN